MRERLIAARYRAAERLGSGGMAAVWRAVDTRTGRDVAIKRLLPGIGRDPAARERLRREAKAMSSVDHPNIVKVLDVVDDEGSPAIVMDRVDGMTLADRLQTGPLPEHEALAVAIDVAEALGAAHAAGFVHRDVKPGNILLAEDGRARLLDFGIASDLSGATDDLTVDGVVGTMRYLAPERLLGEAATTATDVWGVGVLLYEALSGQPAFPATTLVARVDAAGRAVERPSGIADATWDVIRQAADGDPARRYRDGAALAAALRSARDALTGAPVDPEAETAIIAVPMGAPVQTPAPALIEPSPAPIVDAVLAPSGRRRRAPVAAAVAVLLVAVVGLAALALDPGVGGIDDDPGPAAVPAALPAEATSSPPPAVTPTPPPAAAQDGDGAGKDKDRGNGKGKGKGNGKDKP